MPKQLRIRSHAIELSVLDYGEPGPGAAPGMLLLHGMRDLAQSLDPIAERFCDRFRVVALDLRGHGDSDHVHYYALQHFVIDVRAAILGLELGRPVLIGHSFGGEVASQYAGLFPEVPRALVLVEGIGPPNWEGEGSREAGLFWARNSIEALDQLSPHGKRVADLDEATARIRRNHRRLDPARARLLAEAGTRPHPEGGLRWKWDPFLRTSWGGFNFRQIEESWERVSCPTLVVNGGASGDFWTRGRKRPRETGETGGYLPEAEFLRRLAFFPDAESVEIPGAGHMVHFDEPRALCDAIDAFLHRRGIGGNGSA